MKYVLRILLILVIGLILMGYYFKSNSEENGEIFIGIGVLAFAFLLMPLFIYQRYKGKNLKKYISSDNKKDSEN